MCDCSETAVEVSYLAKSEIDFSLYIPCMCDILFLNLKITIQELPMLRKQVTESAVNNSPARNRRQHE